MVTWILSPFWVWHPTRPMPISARHICDWPVAPIPTCGAATPKRPNKCVELMVPGPCCRTRRLETRSNSDINHLTALALQAISGLSPHLAPISGLNPYLARQTQLATPSPILCRLQVGRRPTGIRATALMATMTNPSLLAVCPNGCGWARQCLSSWVSLV